MECRDRYDGDAAEVWGRARISPFPRDRDPESLTPCAASALSREGAGAAGAKSVCVEFSGLLSGLPAVCGVAAAVGLAEEGEAAGGDASDAAVPTKVPVNEGEAV